MVNVFRYSFILVFFERFFLRQDNIKTTHQNIVNVNKFMSWNRKGRSIVVQSTSSGLYLALLSHMIFIKENLHFGRISLDLRLQARPRVSPSVRTTQFLHLTVSPLAKKVPLFLCAVRTEEKYLNGQRAQSRGREGERESAPAGLYERQVKIYGRLETWPFTHTQSTLFVHLSVFKRKNTQTDIKAFIQLRNSGEERRGEERTIDSRQDPTRYTVHFWLSCRP